VIKAFSEVFTPEVRDVAQRLFASGRVEVLAIDDAFLTTSVKDVTTERVVIKKRADRFQISCTCPEGKSGACAHVLASMLAARGHGFGQTEPAGTCPELLYFETSAGGGYYPSREAFEADHPCPE